VGSRLRLYPIVFRYSQDLLVEVGEQAVAVFNRNRIHTQEPLSCAIVVVPHGWRKEGRKGTQTQSESASRAPSRFVPRSIRIQRIFPSIDSSLFFPWVSGYQHILLAQQYQECPAASPLHRQ